MSSDLAVYIIAGAALNFTITYFLIYFGVKTANKEQTRALQIQNLLLAELVKNQGGNPKIAIDQLREIISLKEQKFHGQLTQQQLDSKMEEYII